MTSSHDCNWDSTHRTESTVRLSRTSTTLLGRLQYLEPERLGWAAAEDAPNEAICHLSFRGSIFILCQLQGASPNPCRMAVFVVYNLTQLCQMISFMAAFFFSVYSLVLIFSSVSLSSSCTVNVLFILAYSTLAHFPKKNMKVQKV